MIIEKMTHVGDERDLTYANLLFPKNKAKHMEQKILKDTPEENFSVSKCLDLDLTWFSLYVIWWTKLNAPTMYSTSVYCLSAVCHTLF